MKQPSSDAANEQYSNDHVQSVCDRQHYQWTDKGHETHPDAEKVGESELLVSFKRAAEAGRADI
jgi:hypothetical protein